MDVREYEGRCHTFGEGMFADCCDCMRRSKYVWRCMQYEQKGDTDTGRRSSGSLGIGLKKGCWNSSSSVPKHFLSSSGSLSLSVLNSLVFITTRLNDFL